MDATEYFGSDVFESYSALYSWQSNQVAHAMMGFAGASLFVYTAAVWGQPCWWALVFLLIPILKDVTDYLVDKNKAGIVFELQPRHKKELRFDGVTDFFFWSAGALLALFCYFAALSNSPTVWIAGVMLLIYLAGGSVFFSKCCKPQKQKFDNSGMPFYFRLPNFDGRVISPGDFQEVVEGFITGNGSPHLLLVGPPGSAKTTLACGIGCGLTSKKKAVRYRTSEKLREELMDNTRAGIAGLIRADMIICDDMLIPFKDPGLINTARSILKTKRVIWVLARDTDHLADWKQWLTDHLGIQKPLMLALDKRQQVNSDRKRPSISTQTMAFVTLAVVAVFFAFVLWTLLFSKQTF